MLLHRSPLAAQTASPRRVHRRPARHRPRGAALRGGLAAHAERGEGARAEGGLRHSAQGQKDRHRMVIIESLLQLSTFMAAQFLTGQLGSSTVEAGEGGRVGRDELEGLILRLHLPPFLETVPVLDRAGVILRKIVLVVLHLVAAEGPHLVLEVLQDLESVELHPDHLGGVLQEELLTRAAHLHVLRLVLDALHLAQLLEEGIGGLADGVFSGRLLLGDLVDGPEVSKTIEAVPHEAQLRLPLPLIPVVPLLGLLLVDDQLLERDEVQPRAGELGVVLPRTILAGVDLELVEH